MFVEVDEDYVEIDGCLVYMPNVHTRATYRLLSNARGARENPEKNTRGVSGR